MTHYIPDPLKKIWKDMAPHTHSASCHYRESSCPALMLWKNVESTSLEGMESHLPASMYIITAPAAEAGVIQPEQILNSQRIEFGWVISRQRGGGVPFGLFSLWLTGVIRGVYRRYAVRATVGNCRELPESSGGVMALKTFQTFPYRNNYCA